MITVELDIQELYSKAKEYISFSCKPTNSKYRKDTVFDDEKSVKWNREEVERRNKLHEDEVAKLNTQKNLLLTELRNDIEKYIVQETRVSKERAKKIYQYIYEKYHSYGLIECINNLDDLLELFK